MRFARWPRIVLLFAAFLLGLAPAVAVVAGTCPSAKDRVAATGVMCDCQDHGCMQPAPRMCGACVAAVIDAIAFDFGPPPLPDTHNAVAIPARLGQTLEPPVPPPET